MIGSFASSKSGKLHTRRRQAMNRSLSCPALVELKSKRALDACADMLAAFDSVEEAKASRRIPKALSLDTLPEADEERAPASAELPSTVHRDVPCGQVARLLSYITDALAGLWTERHVAVKP